MKKRRNRKLTWILSAVIVVLAVIAVGIGVGTKHSGSKKQVSASKSNRQEDKNKNEKTVQPPSEEKNDTNAADSVSEEAVSEAPVQNNESTEPPQTVAESQAPVVYPETEGARKAYLTFDDGTSVQTDKILDILKQYNIKATFFVTAQKGEENAARYRRIVEEGHSIALHSVSHNYKQVYASLDTFIADVEGIRQFVLETTGVDTHLYRFPGGSSNTVSVVPMEECIRYLNQNGYRYFDWNVDTSDSVNRKQSVDELLSKVFGTVVDKYHNCVILMHDAALQEITVAALPQIIEGLQARGLEILPITENTPVVQHRKFDTVQ